MEGAEHPIAMHQKLRAVAIREPLEGQLVSGAKCRKKRRLIDLSHRAGVRYHDKVPPRRDCKSARSNDLLREYDGRTGRLLAPE